MRRSLASRAVGAALGVGLVLGIVGGGATLSPAAADLTPVPGELSTEADNVSTLTFAVPDGTRPTGVRGVLAAPQIFAGDVEFLVNGEVVGGQGANPGDRVFIPFDSSDLSPQRTVELGLRFVPTDAETACQPDLPVVAVRDLELDYGGVVEQPTTAADFFPATAPRVDVTVLPVADDGVLTAALTGVASLSAAYPEGTDVELSVFLQRIFPRVGKGQRIVRFVSGTGELTSKVTNQYGVPMLTFTGTDEDLLAAARTLGPRRPEDGTTPPRGLRGLRLVADDEPTLDPSLADLGIAPDELRWRGASRQLIEVPQDVFGQPIESLELNLRGAHTALPQGTQAQVNVYLNDFLLGSQLLEGQQADQGVSLDVQAGPTLIDSNNEFRVDLVPLSADGTCLTGADGAAIGMSLDLDDSSITATPGAGRALGFEQFPQSLRGELPVAIRASGPQQLVDRARDAASLVSGLQRAAARPLEVRVVGADSFVAGEESGLLVGASAADAIALDAPLPLDGADRLPSTGERLELTGRDGYAALQATADGKRQVLLLGGYSAQDRVDGQTWRLAVRVAARGWFSLRDDVLVRAEDGSLQELSSGRQPAQTTEEEEPRSYAVWFISVIVLVLLVLGTQIFVTIRRDRRLRDGTATSAADDAEDDEPEGEPEDDVELEDGPEDDDPDEPDNDLDDPDEPPEEPRERS